MIIEGVEQRSPEWYRQRLGKFSGSRVSELMKSGRKKDELFGDTAMSYIYSVAGERMIHDVFVNDDSILQDYIEQTNCTSKAMRWGIEQEEEAKRLLYKIYPEWEFIDVSSCPHDNIPNFAASPDAVVYNRHNQENNILTIEIKCPSVYTHVKYATSVKDAETLKALKPEYYWQIMAEMSCTNADKGIFVSYCPWLKYPLHCVEIERNEEDIRMMLNRVTEAEKIAVSIVDNIVSNNKTKE